MLLKKSLFLALMMVVAISWTNAKGHAAHTEQEQPIDSNPPPMEEAGPTTGIDFFSTKYLMSGSSFIGELANKNLSVGGNTKAYMVVDTIRVETYLQRWNSTKSKWEDVLAVANKVDFGKSFLTSTKEVKIVRGYYYRTRAVHRINHKGVLEISNSMSQHIFVN